MSKLKSKRELLNLTQEELSEKSGVSVRTIQRIESGKEPKGYTLRVLAEKLNIKEKELQDKPIEIGTKEDFKENPILNEEPVAINYSTVKWINLSSLPFIIVPLFNILVPLFLMLYFKIKHPIIKQIISLQIMWTIAAPILFIFGIFLKLGNNFTLVMMIAIVLSNVYLILRNTIELDKHQKLHYQLYFSMI
jgi:transcriptional regulator with XRE-family HTH domain